jgi:hypothetical protein
LDDCSATLYTPGLDGADDSCGAVRTCPILAARLEALPFACC